MTNILIAEDDELQAELLRRYAVSEGHRVQLVGDGRAAIETARRDRPDLMVLDLMLPHVDGLDVCRVLRAETALPIIMVTARASEDELLAGLEHGADDYLTKPFSPRELMGRVRALLRRAGALGPTQRTVTVGDLVLDLDAHLVSHGGGAVDLTPGEFSCLELMASQPGRVFSREQLIRQLHGVHGFVSSRTIDVHIANLRKKLELDAEHPPVVKTVYGVGYAVQHAI